MNRLHLGLFFIFLGALGAAWLALPNDEEHIAMLVRDGYKVEALEKLEGLYAKGDRSRNNVKQLIKLRVNQGREKGMEVMINDYLLTRPNDEMINDFRLWLYELDGQHDHYLEHVEALVDRTASPKYFEKLVGFYRVKGDTDQEIRVLEKYRDKKVMGAADFQRLGAIYADRGLADQALSAFRQMDTGKINSAERFTQGRLTMFRLLLENNFGNEAVKRADRWVKHSSGNELVYGLMKELDDYGRFDLAMKMGENSMDFSPDKVFVVVDFLNAKKQYSLSRALLKRWKNNTKKLTGKQIEIYVKSCVNARDTPSIMSFLQEHGIQRLPSSTITVLAQEFVYQKQYSLLSVIRPFLAFDAMKKSPLFAAKIALLDGERDLAQELVADITPAILEPYDSPVWIDVMTDLQGEGELYYTLKGYYQQKKLPKQFKQHYAFLARKLGKVKEYNTVLAELGGAFPVRGYD